MEKSQGTNHHPYSTEVTRRGPSPQWQMKLIRLGHVQSVLTPPPHSAASDFSHKNAVQLPQFLVDSRSDHCVHASFQKFADIPVKRYASQKYSSRKGAQITDFEEFWRKTLPSIKKGGGRNSAPSMPLWRGPSSSHFS